MIKIGITGSLASGKTTASQIISKNKGLLFSADSVVKKLYLKKNFKLLISKKLGIKPALKIKENLRKKIINNKKNLSKLEKIIHPFVRKEMFYFIKKNKKSNFLFFEIPLLIESKLMKHFNVIIFIKSKKSLRLKRYRKKGGEAKLFRILDNHQMKDHKKTKFCDYIVVNNSSLQFLKKKLLNIIQFYE